MKTTFTSFLFAKDFSYVWNLTSPFKKNGFVQLPGHSVVVTTALYLHSTLSLAPSSLKLDMVLWSVLVIQ